MSWFRIRNDEPYRNWLYQWLCPSPSDYELVVAYQKGWLKDGQLKEISATLDDESNPVLMFYKHKKKE